MFYYRSEGLGVLEVRSLNEELRRDDAQPIAHAGALRHPPTSLRAYGSKLLHFRCLMVAVVVLHEQEERVLIKLLTF
jgi:hypothetical protein